jgi:predicted nucleic acid-binding protein
MTAGAGFIILGDKHLLNLKRYKTIKIVTHAEFLMEFRA